MSEGSERIAERVRSKPWEKPKAKQRVGKGGGFMKKYLIMEEIFKIFSKALIILSVEDFQYIVKETKKMLNKFEN